MSLQGALKMSPKAVQVKNTKIELIAENDFQERLCEETFSRTNFSWILFIFHNFRNRYNCSRKYFRRTLQMNGTPPVHIHESIEKQALIIHKWIKYRDNQLEFHREKLKRAHENTLKYVYENCLLSLTKQTDYFLCNFICLHWLGLQLHLLQNVAKFLKSTVDKI